MQGLTGTFPASSTMVSAKISEVRLANTSLRQCSASHVAALQDVQGPAIVHAGSSSHMAPDNDTDCLPDMLQFCEQGWAGPGSNMFCPSVAFRRPVLAPPNNLAKVYASQHGNAVSLA